MPNRSWDALVREGRELVQQEGSLQWRWGDLALEVEPMGENRGGKGAHGTGDRLRTWAEEVGFGETGRAFETLLKYREAANQWPPAKRRYDLPFGVHEVLAYLPERFDAIQERKRWTKTEAMKRAGRSVDSRLESLETLRSGPRPAPTATEVRAALSNPAIAREVVRDPGTLRAVREAEIAVGGDEWARQREHDTTPVGRDVEDAVFGRGAAEQRERERPFTFPERYWGNMVAAAQMIAMDWAATQVKRLSRDELSKIVDEGRSVVETVENVVTAAEETLERRGAKAEERS